MYIYTPSMRAILMKRWFSLNFSKWNWTNLPDPFLKKKKKKGTHKMEENLSKPACIRANSLQEEGKRRGEGEDLAMEKLLSLAEELSHYHSNARSIPTIWIFRQLSRSPDLHRWGQGRQPTIYFHAWNVGGRSIPILRQQEGERERDNISHPVYLLLFPFFLSPPFPPR